MKKRETRIGLIAVFLVFLTCGYLHAQRSGPAANGGSLAPGRIAASDKAKTPTAEGYREAIRHLGLNSDDVMLPCATSITVGQMCEKLSSHI